MDDASLFTLARGNLVDTVLTTDPDSPNSAVAALAALSDADGHPLGIQPAILLTGPSLAATTRRLFVSTEIRNTTANTAYVVANQFHGMFKPLVSAYLESSAISGSSSTGWYLLADPRVSAVMDVCFLGGNESPTIESADADFDVLGVQFRGYHDFGVAKSEYRAGVKSSGDAA